MVLNNSMVYNNLSVVASDWELHAHKCILKGNYSEAATIYEQAILVEPNVKFYYWYWGLMLLLQGLEAEAQTAWLLGMAEGEPEEVDLWTEELIQVLEAEAERRRLDEEDYQVAWVIRQHIREINPEEINTCYI
jgi:tetratricopeptide (TPR) repeat protein